LALFQEWSSLQVVMSQSPMTKPHGTKNLSAGPLALVRGGDSPPGRRHPPVAPLQARQRRRRCPRSGRGSSRQGDTPPPQPASNVRLAGHKGTEHFLCQLVNLCRCEVVHWGETSDKHCSKPPKEDRLRHGGRGG